MVITLFNPKGGAGKTAVAMHGGAALMARGYRVLVADADPLGIALRWHKLGAAEGRPVPEVVGVGRTLRQALKPRLARYDVVLIDTAGRLSDRLGAALSLSDLVLIPVKPQVSDVWALEAALDAIHDAQRARPELKVALCLCCARRALIAQGAERAIRALELPTLVTVTRFYAAYDDAQAAGRDVLSAYPRSRAAEDIGNFADELVRSYLPRPTRRKADAA